MALHENTEPPLSSAKTGENKTKNLITNLPKIKNHFSRLYLRLAGAIFLLAGKIKDNRLVIEKYAPTFVLVLLALIATTSNFTVRAAKAKLEDLVVAEPADEVAFAEAADYYTPLINNDSKKVETAYNSRDEFAVATTSVETAITTRTDPALDNTNKSITYTVQGGDTMTSLGWNFGVKLATIKYLNNISDVNSLKPGQKITIPKKGYEVSATLIAQKEKQLAAASRNTVIRASAASRTGSAGVVSHPVGSKQNGYPYGYCTYYVATRRSVPTSMGNAKNWISSARANGMSTGSIPEVGAIVVTGESWYGHVAYVEAVDGNTITIAEMNYAGWGVVDRRTMSAQGGSVRGYIY